MKGSVVSAGTGATKPNGELTDELPKPTVRKFQNLNNIHLSWITYEFLILATYN